MAKATKYSVVVEDDQSTRLDCDKLTIAMQMASRWAVLMRGRILVQKDGKLVASIRLNH